MAVHCVPPTWAPCSGNTFGDGCEGAIFQPDPCPPGYTRAHPTFVGGTLCFPPAPPAIYYNPALCGAGADQRRHCHFTFLPGALGDYPTARVDCECVSCPPGYTWNSVSRACCTAACPAGMCWCAAANECIDCSHGKHCAGVATNLWDSFACRWTATAPDCGPNAVFDWQSCACRPCDPLSCPCDATGACTPCRNGITPPCFTERQCAWDRIDCEWDCLDPTCPAGQHYDHHVCRCIPDCPDGQQYCTAGSPPGCISAVKPACADQLGCEWDADSCLWACDPPPCEDPADWDAVKCRCKTSQGLWLLRNAMGRLLRYDAEDGALTQDYFDSDDLNPVTSTIDATTGCSCPAFHLKKTWIWGTYLRNTDEPVLAHSRDHGATYTLTDIPGSYTTLLSMRHRGNRIVILGFRSGAWYQRVVKVKADNTPDVSGEVAVSPALPHTPSGLGALWVEEDGTIVFSWKDTSHNSHISRTSVMSLAAAATWRHS